jgi:type III secretion protein V
VTRVAAEDEETSLGAEIGRQLVAEPGALAAVSALCAALALAPGLPAAPFLALAVAAGAGGWHLARERRAPAASTDGAGAQPPDPAPLVTAFPVALELAPDLVALARADGGRPGREGVSAMQDHLLRELGVRVPPVAVVPGALPAGCWRLLVDDVPAGAGRAPAGEAAALVSPDDLALVGIASTPERDPLTGRAVALIDARDAERAGRLGPVRGPLDRALAEAAWALARAAHQLVGVQEVQVLLDQLEASAPALVREATRQLPAPLLAEVLRRLVEEGVSVRPLRTILEALLEAGAQRGPAALAEVARRALARHIGHRCAGDGPLPALLLDPGAEAVVREGLAGETLALDPAVAARLLESLADELRRHDAPPVLLASPDVRRALRGLVAPRFPRISVLAYEELPPELPVRPIGRLGLSPGAEPA